MRPGSGRSSAGCGRRRIGGRSRSPSPEHAAAADSPSWLAQHPTLDVVYAALEAAQTVRRSSAPESRRSRPLGDPVEAGEAVCHVAVAPDGGSLIASCWGDGRVVRMALDAAGRPSAPVLGAAAADPFGGPVDARIGRSGFRGSRHGHGDRPRCGGALAARGGGRRIRATRSRLRRGGRCTGCAANRRSRTHGPERVSRAHSAAFLPDGRIATTDLGFDLVRIWRPTGAGLRLDHEVVLPLGSGPRHMVLHPSGHLHVVTEFSCEVFTLGAGRDGRWSLIGGVAVGPPGSGQDTGGGTGPVTRRRFPLRRTARQQHDRDAAGARRRGSGSSRSRSSSRAWTGRGITSSCATRCSSPGSGRTTSCR